MSENMVIKVLNDAINTGIMLAAPILIVSLVVGLLISIFQATTQIQEQTLTFVPKLIAVALVGILASTWMLHTMTGLTNRIFEMITNITN
ncbi:MAG: flagellar biosynthesis protein FliQ [Bacillota bacterium]|nr:flagellar biosynthesis protein FliQ [Bacillota bacterium]